MSGCQIGGEGDAPIPAARPVRQDPIAGTSPRPSAKNLCQVRTAERRWARVAPAGVAAPCRRWRRPAGTREPLPRGRPAGPPHRLWRGGAISVNRPGRLSARASASRLVRHATAPAAPTTAWSATSQAWHAVSRPESIRDRPAPPCSTNSACMAASSCRRIGDRVTMLRRGPQSARPVVCVCQPIRPTVRFHPMPTQVLHGLVLIHGERSRHQWFDAYFRCFAKNTVESFHNSNAGFSR